MYIDKLDDVVDKNNNTYHSTIKVKPTDVKSNTYFDFEAENSNNKNPIFKVGGHVRISKYKVIFAKGDTQNLPEEVLLLKKLKILHHGHI